MEKGGNGFTFLYMRGTQESQNGPRRKATFAVLLFRLLFNRDRGLAICQGADYIEVERRG